MAPINFPTSPAVGDTTVVTGRTFVWDGTTWRVANTNPTGLEFSFDAANSANAAVVSATLQTRLLKNVKNNWTSGNLNVHGNVNIYGNTTLGAQDTLRITLPAGKDYTSNALVIYDSGGNALMQLTANGQGAPIFVPGNEQPTISGMDPDSRIHVTWFLEKLNQDFATAATGNNRTGWKITGLPGHVIAFKVFATVYMNAGTSGATSANVGLLFSQNVYPRGVLGWHPLTPTTVAQWAPTSNTGGAQVGPTTATSVPNTAVPTLIYIVGMADFAVNSVNTVGGPNVEVTFGTETAATGAQILANSFITYVIFP